MSTTASPRRLRAAANQPAVLAVRRWLRRRRQQSKLSFEAAELYRYGNSVFVKPRAATSQSRFGVYLFGSCELPSLLDMGHMIASSGGLVAPTAIAARAKIHRTRPDVLLQTLDPLPTQACSETIERLRLHPDYFKPVLFEPTFMARTPQPREFPKSAVFLSLGPALVRSLYRHKEHGFLVDPGGWWMNTSTNTVKNDSESLEWLRSNFTPVGRLTPETWAPLFRCLVTEVRARTGAEVVVVNALTIEPGDPTFSYELRRSPEGVRRRKFLIALEELADELNFGVVDADRLLKGEGVREQVDFAHFPASRHHALAAEALRLLRLRGVL